MKKSGFMLLLIITTTPLLACDICGGNISSSYMGILPEFSKRYIGLRYQQNSLLHHLGANGASTYLTTKESYYTAEVWAATNIGNKFRLAVFAPVNVIQRSNQQEKSSHHGMGDITTIGYYRLLNRQQTIGHNNQLRQSLWLGAGIKLPTGEYNPEDKNIQQALQNTFQLGTGSTDFSLHTTYDISFRNAGTNVNAGYKINTANPYNYKYGNKFSLNILAYYKLNLGNTISVAPNTGVLFEQSGKDERSKDLQVWETGGHSTVATVGLELTFGKINAGGNFQTPLAQNLGEGKIKTNNRCMIHIGFSI